MAKCTRKLVQINLVKVNMCNTVVNNNVIKMHEYEVLIKYETEILQTVVEEENISEKYNILSVS